MKKSGKGRELKKLLEKNILKTKCASSNLIYELKKD
jgi:hypothetical protein